eukprot:362779-Chlamydomonas_euryale.AAC.4
MDRKAGKDRMHVVTHCFSRLPLPSLQQAFLMPHTTASRMCVKPCGHALSLQTLIQQANIHTRRPSQQILKVHTPEPSYMFPNVMVLRLSAVKVDGRIGPCMTITMSVPLSGCIRMCRFQDA